MALILEVEFLTGVAYTAVSPDSPIADWPPQPDRIFSALVATWGVHGCDEGQAAALRWLEALEPPSIHASEADIRSAAIRFVPPNDQRTSRKKNAAGVIPRYRSRQQRFFPAARPTEPIVRFVWDGAEPEAATLQALGKLAFNTAYVGHSSSLTRCRFTTEDHTKFQAHGKAPKRIVYRGRLEELQSSYASFLESGGKSGRPLRGPTYYGQFPVPAKVRSVFAQRWIVLEHVRSSQSEESRLNVMPDFRASALVARAIRDTLLSGYKKAGLEGEIPEVISGHTATGSPSQSPHIAIVPLAFVGAEFADGHVVGFALIVPESDAAILENADFKRALRSLSSIDEDTGRRIITVKSRHGATDDTAFLIRLSPTFEPSRQSLNPDRYIAAGRAFGTVTPILLDKHLKKKGEARKEEIESQIVSACKAIGLPEPNVIVADKHSAFEGVPSATPSSRSPLWMRWQMPPSYASRPLTHATLRFPVDVEGPILLGSGRYLGLGLCRNLEVK